MALPECFDIDAIYIALSHRQNFRNHEFYLKFS